MDCLLGDFKVNATFLRCSIVLWICKKMSLSLGHVHGRVQRSVVVISAISF